LKFCASTRIISRDAGAVFIYTMRHKFSTDCVFLPADFPRKGSFLDSDFVTVVFNELLKEGKT